MMLRLVMLAAALPLAACALPAPEREREVRAPAIEVAGVPTNCIQTSRIENTVVHDDYTVDFEMAGDMIYRNTLPNRCFSLGFEERFAYSTTTGQLCSIDTITVLHGDGEQGARCALGEFLPVRYVEAD